MFMQQFLIRTLAVSLFFVLLYIGVKFWYTYIIIHYQKKHRYKQVEHIKFLQIKISKNSAAKWWDLEATDHIQSMKQNIEIMNQIYKNLYAIYVETRKTKNLWHHYISLETIVEKESIKFIMWIAEENADNIEKIIWSFYPWSLIEEIAQPTFLEAWKYLDWWEIVLSKDNPFPIKTYETFEADPMDSLLSSFSKTFMDEKMWIQILIAPIDESRQKDMRKAIEDIKKPGKSRRLKAQIKVKEGILWSEKKDDKEEDEENKYDYSQQQLWDIDKKVDEDLFHIKMRVFATSPDPERPEKLINWLTRSFNQYNYIWLNSFSFIKSNDLTTFARSLSLRSFFSEWTTREKLKSYQKYTILNMKELSSIVHFPHSRFNRSPRIRRQNYKVVPAPDNIPTEGILLWHNTYGWKKTEIRVAPFDRFRHFYTIWQTGTGKSAMMESMAIQDVQQWNWFCLIDPHGDLCEHVLQYIPKDRIDDLIYFDFANTEYPIWFNVFEAENADERDIVTNDIVEMFENMYWKEIFWPRIQDYFRNAAMTLMEQPDWWTLTEIMRLFTDEAYLDSKLKHVTDPVVLTWRNKTYKSMGDREKKEIIPFFQAKFGPFTQGIYVRNVIGQPKSAFKFWEAMQQKKIILCNLSKGLTWEINSQLIGRMIAIQIKLNALKRASIPEDERIPFFLYVDEFQNYVSQSFESILSEARKYRLWLSVAHQYIEQLKSSWLGWSLDLSKAIFGNIGSQLYLKVWPEDAEFLEKNIQPEFTKQDLLNMDKFKGIMQLSIWTQPSRPFSIAPYYILWTPVVNTPEKVAIIKQIAALKRWTQRKAAEKEIFYRIWV